MALVPNRLTELASAVASGELDPLVIVEDALKQAERNASLNDFLCICKDSALEGARQLKAQLAGGAPAGPLCGVPIAVKDAICTTDAPTTAASKILTRDGTHASGFRPAYDATVVARLREAGAIVFGKTNMDEFAMGSSNENSAFGPVKNPWDETRTPGGSSGGSAACVGAGTVLASLGSDTGGSIRQPASHCGVVGVKPSYGRVSRYGLIAFASSLDQIGPIATDVKGAARVLEVIAGPDGRDSTCADRAVGAYERACERELEPLKVGIPKEYFAEGLEDDVKQCVQRVVDYLNANGCEVVDVSLPHTQYGISTYYLVATAEASSNLSRFDGVRYGARNGAPNDLLRMYEKTRGDGFGPEVKRRIMLGTYALSTGYYDAYYRKAQQVRTLIRNDFDAAFAKADVLLTPVSPSAAFPLGERVDDPLKMYLADVYTLPASLAGVCAISVPAGVSTAGKRPLPVGVQFIAPAFGEETLFNVGAAWERHAPVSALHPER